MRDAAHIVSDVAASSILIKANGVFTTSSICLPTIIIFSASQCTFQGSLLSKFRKQRMYLMIFVLYTSSGLTITINTCIDWFASSKFHEIWCRRKTEGKYQVEQGKAMNQLV